ncbi:hypothetical protein MTO96_005708 [Rhipicephalus appendiculatus]
MTGFRPRLSAQDSVLDLLSHIEHHRVSGLSTLAVFMDVAKAYDCVLQTAMTTAALRSVRERVAACARWIRRSLLPTSTSSEHIDEESPENGGPNLRPANHQLTGPPFIFSLKYIQTAPGALNLTETCLSVVLYKTLCSHAEETLSAALFTFSFAYSIAGLYMLLNGIFNAPSSEIPSHPSSAHDLNGRGRSSKKVKQQLLYHCVGSFVFLVCGIYVLARYFNASTAVFASVVSFMTAAVHLGNTIYIYRGDFQRFI